MSFSIAYEFKDMNEKVLGLHKLYSYSDFLLLSCTSEGLVTLSKPPGNINHKLSSLYQNYQNRK